MRDARQGWFSQLLRSSYLAPLTLAVIAVLVVGIVVQLLVITGPGRVGDGQIQVYALGAVVAPGVYALPGGARVHDLVSAAGGATADADLTRVSLAGALADGGTVSIPRVGEAIPLMLGGCVQQAAET
jgi:hypothetical protein